MTIADADLPSREDYAVYVTAGPPDMPWAEDLVRQLVGLGVSVLGPVDLAGAASVPTAEAMSALPPSAVLVVLWSDAMDDYRLSGLAAPSSPAGVPWQLIPVLLEPVDRASLPLPLAERRPLVLDRDGHEQGPHARSAGWQRIVDAIADYGRVPVDAASAADLPPFSAAARDALDSALVMLGDSDADPARLRTAAFLGALQVSAQRGAAPTTGDVVRLVADRQHDGRSPQAAIVAAAATLGFGPIGLSARPRDPRTLLRSAVAPLVREASAIAQRTGGAKDTSVHLRQVLATGIDAAVPQSVLAEASG